tara:strand:- start:138 stop:365 length:228 start_codon:yes stop_codon:yes gene_type:complete
MKKRKSQALSKQVGGAHYKQASIQPIEFILAHNLNFCSANVVKYICRNKGNRVEDLKKAKHYIELELELLHNETD